MMVSSQKEGALYMVMVNVPKNREMMSESWGACNSSKYTASKYKFPLLYLEKYSAC